jgi:peroxygenase
MYQDPYNIITENKDHKDHKDHKNERSVFRRHKHDDDDIITEAKEVPVTVEHKVPHDLIDSLGNAGLPRATIAASKEVPNGTSGRPKNKTVLQQHVEFFDTDHDNIIYPLDTYRGLRRLGFNFVFSSVNAAVIHGGLAYASQPNWIPILGNPFFKIYVNNIHRDKHGSDSEAYDTEGRYVPQKFEEIFSKYDKGNKGGLDIYDLGRMIRGNANANDIFGTSAAVLEWGTLYLLCAQNGIVSKEDARTCLDGTLFYRMAETEDKRQKGVRLSDVLKNLKEE